jgi:organic hydroperoxide reductase OsmC/OhrA
MTTPLPHRYDVALNWKDGPVGTLLAAPRPAIAVGKPPQFGGKEDWWSPEHLLLGSAASCFMATYLSLAERQKLKVLSLRCEAAGELGKAEDGPRFTAITLNVAVEALHADQERAERLLETAKKHCLIANSLKAAVTLEIRRGAAA